ncbi:YhgE/Pip domain-containing protein [Paenibacillus sp. JCM 10914]|uniref:YhgE/Pip domain-containing protein n=1 Tax=Paenibacillus sp. JCM 10914 TaxID=1236974 RepID=UPI0003CCA250|nr:ABC transporter permease [Paenibacillus sp. JCM 10914]GAE06346.1 membrane protein, putative [Paenibacillus sp. JCM 10914]
MRAGLFKQKTLWLGILAVFVVLSIFGVAMMGSVAGAKPKSLPVALVVLDESATLPDGGTLAVGDMMKDMLQSNSQLPVKWDILKSETAAREGLDAQKYYGALILPANLSAGVLSMQTSAPAPAVVQILVNEGMSVQASTAVKQMLGQAMQMAGDALSQQMLSTIGSQTEVIPVTTAQALLTPFQVQEEVVHPVGVNHASGNAPGMLIQILWIGCLIVSVVLYQVVNQASGRNRLGGMVLIQGAMGIVLAGVVSGFLVWMASSWYGMEMNNAASIWFVLWLSGSAFFLIQSTLLNWLGFPAMGILVLLMFFSMPVLNMAPEFLPQVTQDWLYTWTPLRIAGSSLRDVMYFDGLTPYVAHTTILWAIAAAFLALFLTSVLKKANAKEKNASALTTAS